MSVEKNLSSCTCILLENSLSAYARSGASRKMNFLAESKLCRGDSLWGDSMNEKFDISFVSKLFSFRHFRVQRQSSDFDEKLRLFTDRIREKSRKNIVNDVSSTRKKSEETWRRSTWRVSKAHLEKMRPNTYELVWWRLFIAY